MYSPELLQMLPIPVAIIGMGVHAPHFQEVEALDVWGCVVCICDIYYFVIMFIFVYHIMYHILCIYRYVHVYIYQHTLLYKYIQA